MESVRPQVNDLVGFGGLYCLHWFSLFLNKFLKYGFVGCLYLLLKLVQVQVTGSETSGDPREPHSDFTIQVEYTSL